MNYTVEKQKKKFFIGLELRTNNEECSSTMPAHKERFFNENTLAKYSGPQSLDNFFTQTSYTLALPNFFSSR